MREKRKKDDIVRSLTGKERAKRGVAAFFINVIPILYTLTCVVPLVWIAYSSLKTLPQFEADQIGLPTNPTFDAYTNLLKETNIFGYIGNTLFNAVISTLLVLLIGFVNGYFFSRFRFKGRNLMYNYYMLGLLVPVHALLVPTYIIFSSIGLLNTMITLIPLYICCTITTTIFLVESYISGIPRELEEAAAIDGSSFTRTLFTIIFPISTPILISAGVIAFFFCWNEFSFALVLLNQDRFYTVPLALMMYKGQNRVDYPRMMAIMFVSIVPALLLYGAFSKQIMKGMVAGAVKG